MCITFCVVAFLAKLLSLTNLYCRVCIYAYMLGNDHMHDHLQLFYYLVVVIVQFLSYIYGGV